MKYFLCILVLITVLLPVLADLFTGKAKKRVLPFPGKIMKYRSLTGKAADAARCLHPGTDPEKAVRRHVLRKLRILYGMAAGIVCLLTVYFCFGQSPRVENNRVARMEADGSSRSVDLSAEIGGEKENVTIQIAPRRYDEQERAVLMQEVKAYISQKIPGENPDLSHVTLPLSFPDTVPGKPVSIEWMPEDYNLIRQDGTLGEVEMEWIPVTTSVRALIHYEEFTEEETYPVTITGLSLDGQESLKAELDAALQKADESSREEEALFLPSRIGGKEVVWKYQKGLLLPAAAGMVLAGALFFLYRQEDRLQKEMDRRNKELEREYPVFVQRMVLMLGAGMTVRRSWESIVKEDDGQSKYLKREMQYALRRMNAGIPETEVYREFGMRMPGYAPFCQLLMQVIRKGSRGMQEMMMREAKDAEQRRREMARQLGETAGTRLLLPMMMLLILVLVIVMAPAMLSM